MIFVGVGKTIIPGFVSGMERISQTIVSGGTKQNKKINWIYLSVPGYSNEFQKHPPNST